MGNDHRSDGYKPYKGKRRLHIDKKTRRIPFCITAEAPPVTDLLDQRCRSGETIREIDDRLGWLGQSHAARLIARMG